MFERLWNSYPGVDYPCSVNGKPLYDNQCAIRLGVCFESSGISTQGWGVTKCPIPVSKGHKGHTLRTHELASVLDARGVPAIGAKEQYSGAEMWIERIRERTGIILFRNYYYTGTSPSTNRPDGHHIDLWNKDQITGWWTSLRRFNRFSRGGDFNNGQIWFWPLA